MINKTLQVTESTDPLKTLERRHQDERRRLHNWRQTQMQTFWVEQRSAYEKSETEQARTVLLATFVQKISKLRQAYTYRQKRLLARQARQREKLIIKAANPPELDRRKRIKIARLIIETYAKSGSISLATFYP